MGTFQVVYYRASDRDELVRLFIDELDDECPGSD